METTITLNLTSAARIAITVGGELLATTKDGHGLVTRSDRILGQHGIYRSSGYDSQGDCLVAKGADLR